MHCFVFGAVGTSGFSFVVGDSDEAVGLGVAVTVVGCSDNVGYKEGVNVGVLDG